MSTYGKISAAALLIWSVSGNPASAQSIERRFEVGFQVAAPALGEFSETDVGVGGRLSYRLTSLLAVEGGSTSCGQTHG